MIFVWQRAGLIEGDEFSVFVQYRPGGPNLWTVILILLGLLAVSVAYGYFSDWRFKTIVPRLKKEKKSMHKHPVEKELELLRHLKEEEQQLIRVLKDRDGQCEQGTLRIATDFSKAHLSRLLSELEARKVIRKERRGKKNIVFLKKQ